MTPTSKSRRTASKIIFAATFLFSIQKIFALDVQIFRPNHSRSEGIVGYSSSSLYTGELQASIFFNYVKNPLEFGFLDSNSRVQGIVNSASTANLLFSYGLSDHLTLGLDFPVHVINDIQGITNLIEGEKDYTPGDPRIFLNIPLVRAQTKTRRGFGLALVPSTTFSFGNTGDFLGNAGFVAGGKLVLDHWFGERNYFGLNGGFFYRQDREVIQNLEVGHELPWSATYVHVVAPESRWDLIGELYGSMSYDSPFKFTGASEVASPIDSVLALRKRWSHAALTMGGGAGLNSGYGSPDYRVFLGLTFSKFNSQEKKPSPPPEPVTNREPEIKDGSLTLLIRNEKGVPVQAEVVVKASTGKLRDRIRTAEWNRSLPADKYEISIDLADHQWVYREITLEQGQNLTEVITLIAIKKKGDKIDVLGKILFDLNKDSLKPESYEVLDHVVEVMNQHPEILKMRIEAHTDSLSSIAYNLDLSNRRALTVKNYLVESGIEASRLDYRGYGESFPIKTNDTEEGRSQNRRVEFLILESSTSKVKTKTNE